MNIDFSNVRKKPFLIDQLPWIGRGTCTAIYPYVWLSRKAYDNLYKSEPGPYSLAVVLHEQEHLKHMKERGVLKFYLKYMFVPSFRFNEELQATKPQFAYLKAAGLTYDLKRKAKQLSGWLYFRAANYDTALASVKDLWDNS